jgi:hypothetical protein
VFGALLLIGLIVKYYWWFIAAAAAVGLFFAVRALVRHARERKAAAAREAEELAYRADRQHRWARRGDSRGVYGVEGAELMRSISPEPPKMPTDASTEGPKVAAIAQTSQELTRLLAEKAPGWRWAAFASVLVQRRAVVQPRLRDCQLGYASPTGERADTGAEVARFVTGRMDEVSQLVGQLEAFMLAPAFMGVFGSKSDEGTADADGIVHVANRLMDFHERFLTLAERCRDLQAPSRYTALMRDCSQLMHIPLDGYRVFIDDFVEVIAEMPELIRHGRGTVEADTISLHMDVDEQLVKRINKQVRAAAQS